MSWPNYRTLDSGGFHYFIIELPGLANLWGLKRNNNLVLVGQRSNYSFPNKNQLFVIEFPTHFLPTFDLLEDLRFQNGVLTFKISRDHFSLKSNV